MEPTGVSRYVQISDRNLPIRSEPIDGNVSILALVGFSQGFDQKQSLGSEELYTQAYGFQKTW